MIGLQSSTEIVPCIRAGSINLLGQNSHLSEGMTRGARLVPTIFLQLTSSSPGSGTFSWAANPRTTSRSEESCKLIWLIGVENVDLVNYASNEELASQS